MKHIIEEVIKKRRKIHFVGIGGCGMSAIARVLINLGYQISGSDQKESANTIKLKEQGVDVKIEHAAINVRDAGMVVVSAAIKANNPEIEEAKMNGVPVFERAQMLGYLMSLFKESIAFAGTHGKTTTSAMAAYLFNKAGIEPTFLVGGDVADLGTNGEYGNSEYFIAEADESDGSIKYLDPKILVINNLEKDHLDYFDNLDNIIDLFANCVERLVQNQKHLLFINLEQWGNKLLWEKVGNTKGLNFLRYGEDEGADIRAINIRFQGKGSIFSLVYKGQMLGELELAIPGKHNVLNALSVIGIALEAGIEFNKIKVILKSFNGARRRFTFIGESSKVKVYEDYAHHPTEIKATLEAARHVFPKSKIICIFQPHRYSRTMFFMKEFAESLALADKIIVTNIYGAGEEPIKNISSARLVDEMDSDKAICIEKKEDIPPYLEERLKSNDVILVLGAGDIYSISKEIVNRLKIKYDKKEKSDDNKIIRIA